MRLTVSQLEWPDLKLSSPQMSLKNQTRCSGRYRAAHCGPLALAYHVVSLDWPGGEVTWNRTHMVVSEDQSLTTYNVEDIGQVMLWREGRHRYNLSR